VQWNLRDGCSEKTKKQRRRNNLVDGEVVAQRQCSSGVGGTKMQCAMELLEEEEEDAAVATNNLLHGATAMQRW